MEPNFTATVVVPDTTESCDWGGAYCPPAEIYAADGKWCSSLCQSYDRMSEYRLLRPKAVAA